jgi:hypothetical protein
MTFEAGRKGVQTVPEHAQSSLLQWLAVANAHLHLRNVPLAMADLPNP